MKTFFDVQQLLKQYGIVIYTRDKQTDIALIQMELRTLYEYGLVNATDYKQALFLVKREEATHE
ncbi:YqgQ family protein [Shouchella lonarensis]|uniref:Uncharacterized protein YqgQ n=1 Tax=Shouchella lonarensis TaxID=1464122 RepID=A0A1G6IW36_9BACI|nr:YqgQ family protein [Shouchella lonarensis]SDC09966.1 Uncharacterized protein YqgQ [Shouchella lonarensis]